MKRLSRTNWLTPVLILFALTPLLWFVGRPGVIIDGVDTNFPLDPNVWFARRLWLWNSTSNAGVNLASSTAGLFFHFVQVVPFTLGASLQLTEIISLVFWFGLLVLAAYIFAKQLTPHHKIAQLVIVTLYVYNTYLFNTWENVKVSNIALVVGLPLVLSLFLASTRKKIATHRVVAVSALIGLLISGSGINPAYFIAIVGAICLASFVYGNFKGAIAIIASLVMTNIYWIISTIRQLFFADTKVASLVDYGLTNWLDSLSENTSLLNVFRLQGAWDWYAKDAAGAPLYIPYAPNFLTRFPFVAFSLGLVALVLFSLAISQKTKRKQTAFFALMLVISVFIGTGSHPPTGVLYKLLVTKFAFLSFFRSPWYIFAPYTALATAALVGVLFAHKLKYSRWLAVILVFGNLVYTYPLVTGKIFRPDSLNGFYIQFPDYVFATKSWLEANPKSGRILTYPGDDIERFNWGYTGVETILGLFSDRELIFSGLNSTSTANSKLIGALYTSLRRNQPEFARNISSRLNISQIFNKHDQSSLWGDLPETIQGYPTTQFGQWNFMDLPMEWQLPKLFVADKLYMVATPDSQELIAGFLDKETGFVNQNDSVVKQIPNVSRVSGTVVLATNSQLTDFTNYTSASRKQTKALHEYSVDEVRYEINLEKGGEFAPMLEKINLDKFGVDWQSGLAVQVDGTDWVWQAQGAEDAIVFAPIHLSAGHHVIRLTLAPKNLLAEYPDVLAMTNRDSVEQDELLTVDHLDTNQPYLIEFDYRNHYGEPSFVRIEQKSDSVNYKFSAEMPPFSPEWTHFNFYFNPIITQGTKLDIKPAAPTAIANPLGTKLEYANFGMYRVFTNRLVLISQPTETFGSGNVDFTQISPIKYSGTVTDATGNQLLVFSENYSRDWKLTIFAADGSPLDYDPLHFSVNLFANGWLIENSGDEYRFEITYKPQTMYIVSLIASLIFVGGVGTYSLYRKWKN